MEEAQGAGRDTLLTDLGKVLELADRLLGDIDCIGETASSRVDIIGTVLQTVRSLDDIAISDRNAVASHMLVVDDIASNRDLLERRLVREGRRVSIAENGASALEMTGESFDLAVAGVNWCGSREKAALSAPLNTVATLDLRPIANPPAHGYICMNSQNTCRHGSLLSP